MFRFISPKFINKFDAWLLKNHPVLWMSRIHYVLWSGAILWGISALLGFVIPIDIRFDVPYELWYFITTLMGLFVLCPWVYHHVIFNKEKRYGRKGPLDEYANFILVSFAVTFFLLTPWPFELVFKSRVANMYTDEEVIEDLNTLNIADPYTLNSNGYFYSWRDTSGTVSYYSLRHVDYNKGDYFTPWMMRYDSLRFPKLLTAYQLNKLYTPSTNKAEVKKKLEDYIRVAFKYGWVCEVTADVMAERWVNRVKQKFVLDTEINFYDSGEYTLDRVFANLTEAKFKTFFLFTDDYFWVMLYCVLAVTMLILLFKKTYWQYFLITLVGIGVYCIIDFILSQLLRHNSYFHIRDEYFFLLGLYLLFIFSAITLVFTIREKRRFRPVFNVFNQVFYLMLMFAPLMTVFILHFSTNVFHNYDYYSHDYYGTSSTFFHVNKTEFIRQTYLETYNGYISEYWAGQYRMWIEWSRNGGIMIFILGLPLLKELFIKQLSLPKKS
ncbi:MAG: hypothetical protein K0S32_4055 [Bacteroidetes bacterium]|jgi:hypothetical protein|nr:hypothetical protein [Bacteroidota bacterium]